MTSSVIFMVTLKIESIILRSLDECSFSTILSVRPKNMAKNIIPSISPDANALIGFVGIILITISERDVLVWILFGSKFGKLVEAKTCPLEMSKIIGETLAKRAVEKKINKVYFDRGGYKYHGRIKALAESLRKNGLNFKWEILNL